MSRLVVISNRVALPRTKREAPGGMAVGIMAALKETGGLWFGWDGKALDPPPTEVSIVENDNVKFATLTLSNKDYDDYYMGYSNRVLWPTFHMRLDLMEFKREHQEGYERVSTLFTRKLIPLLKPDDIIWVHDYHCLPIAAQLRQAGLKQPLGFFLHIPFPSFDILRSIPDYEKLLHWLSSYDLVGLQTDLDQAALLSCARFGIGAKIVDDSMVTANGSVTQTGVFPIGIDVDEVVTKAAKGWLSKQAKRLQKSLVGRQLVTGVDRLDYSKGLVDRFRAFERLIERYPANRGKVVLMQVAQPSRDDVPEYQDIRLELEAIAGRINGRYSEYDWTPIRYLNKGFSRASILGFLAISNVGLVTPLRDGMNLVAKEFIAAQDPGDPGVLVLSHLTGAARELTEALIVNPYDVEDVADKLAKAIAMPPDERIERWQSSMQKLRAGDIHAWSRNFIEKLKAAV